MDSKAYRKTPASHVELTVGVFGILRTDDGLKGFSDHPLWRSSKEEMPEDMNMLSSLLLIATWDQISKKLVINVQSYRAKNSPHLVCHKRKKKYMLYCFDDIQNALYIVISYRACKV